jgi:Tfp pilus assembly protein PilW
MIKLNHTGYTLIELLLYSAVISSLLLALTAFFALTSDSRIKNQTINQVDQQGSYVMDNITQTIRNASSITSPAAAASASSLTLVVPTASLSPTVFGLSSGTLQVTEGTSSAVSLTNSNVTLSNLTFTNLTRSGTKGIMRVSFTLTRVNNLNHNEYDYQKTFVSSAEVQQ